ncbi:apc13 domain containing protein [Grosmannia clavigera kw1407]|uniref:Apc13 domain containing protein n=1 Tax=Grosmannia clavigera (strain kw1407 / UAMH 11150) TaxID=655863 RepID=F0XC96_GROCL|nr:apc13 domain containing protein [Grosmannia clavigera kw1407]EFX04121.1 apc13 domain containing protein [Grosmannia clavigera kw1407]
MWTTFALLFLITLALKLPFVSVNASPITDIVGADMSIIDASQVVSISEIDFTQLPTLKCKHTSDQLSVMNNCRGLANGFKELYNRDHKRRGLTIPTEKCISVEYGACLGTLCNLDVLANFTDVLEDPFGSIMANPSQSSCTQSASEVVWSDGHTLVHLQGLGTSAMIVNDNAVSPDIDVVELHSTNSVSAAKAAQGTEFPYDTALDLSNCPGWEYGRYTCCKTSRIIWDDCMEAIELMANTGATKMMDVMQNSCRAATSGGCTAQLNFDSKASSSAMNKDGCYTSVHMHQSRNADLFEDVCKDRLPDDDIFVPPQHQPINPEDEDDVVPDQHAAFGIQRATQAVREPAWKDLGLAALMHQGPGGSSGGAAGVAGANGSDGGNQGPTENTYAYYAYYYGYSGNTLGTVASGSGSGAAGSSNVTGGVSRSHSGSGRAFNGMPR